MPRGFTAQERELIRGTLLEQGRRLFEIHGLMKTSVDDLARAAGISKGAFYKFFDSKEELFFEILEGLEADFREQVFQDSFQDEPEPQHRFEELLRRALSLWERTPLLKNFSREEYARVVRKLPHQRVQEHFQRDERFLSDFIRRWSDRGYPMHAGPHGLAGILKTLFYACLHKEEFTAQEYSEAMELLIPSIAASLASPEPPGAAARPKSSRKDDRPGGTE